MHCASHIDTKQLRQEQFCDICSDILSICLSYDLRQPCPRWCRSSRGKSALVYPTPHPTHPFLVGGGGGGGGAGAGAGAGDCGGDGGGGGDRGDGRGGTFTIFTKLKGLENYNFSADVMLLE